MGFLTRCKRPFLFAFLLQFCNMLFSFFLKTFLILFEKQHRACFLTLFFGAQSGLCALHARICVFWFCLPRRRASGACFRGFLSGQAPRVRPPTHRKKEETQMDRQYDFAALEALLKKRSLVNRIVDFIRQHTEKYQ